MRAYSLCSTRGIIDSDPAMYVSEVRVAKMRRCRISPALRHSYTGISQNIPFGTLHGYIEICELGMCLFQKVTV